MNDTQDWTPVHVELPPADKPVRVLDSEDSFSNACYCVEANDWYVHRPGHPTHGMLFSEVFGPRLLIIEWRSL